MSGLTPEERSQIQSNFERLRDAYERGADGSIEIQTMLAEQKSNRYADGTQAQREFNEIAESHGFEVQNIDPDEVTAPPVADDRIVRKGGPGV